MQVETWRVMEILEHNTDLTMGDLADLVLMNPPTLTKLVDRMVADGLVHRRNASTDQRKVNLQITALGQKRITQIREAAATEEDELIAHLSAERVNLLKSILSEIGNAPH